MKNKITNITKMGMLLGLTAITALCLASPVHAASSKSSHHGGSGGGLSFYATVSTVSQLIADINYANSVGGAITINLAPGATFDLTSADNTTDGGNGLPVIGGPKAVALTIIGNGDTIKRIAVISRGYAIILNPFRLFEVASGASLTLDHVTLQGDWGGGGILNQGTLNVINGSTLFGNNAGGIYNVGGTVAVSSSTLYGHRGGGIYNVGGTVTVSNSTLSDNLAGNGGAIRNSGGTLTVSHSILSGNGSAFGGGIYNDSSGTVTVDHSTLTNNHAGKSNNDDPIVVGDGDGGAIYNSAGTVTISNSILSGNVADLGGGGIFNDSQGTVTVENSSSIIGNLGADGASLGADVYNLGLFYLDSTSTILGGVGPTSAISF